MATRQRIQRWSGIGLLTGLAALLALAGCGAAPDSQKGKIQVDLAPILQQLGNGTRTASDARAPAFSSPGVTTTVTPVGSLIIGAIVISFQDTPLTPETPITDATKKSLQDAAINSVNFISLVNLPTGGSTVEFNVPPPQASHWQVVLIGLNKNLKVLQDVTNSDVYPIYYGFDPHFHTSQDVGTGAISMSLQRACGLGTSITPADLPLGCASYIDRSTAKVTPAVEILGVLDTTKSVDPATGLIDYGAYDDSTGATHFHGVKLSFNSGTPMIVRSSPTGTQVSATTAGTALTNLVSTSISGNSAIKSVLVLTTHQLSYDGSFNSDGVQTTADKTCLNAGASQLALSNMDPQTTSVSGEVNFLKSDSASSRTCQSIEAYPMTF